jgi:hypothetical protein
MSAKSRYPHLMAYIEDRSRLPRWTDQLGPDLREAEAGGLADVVADLRSAYADYGRYPYNSAMGEFLGLELRANNEPAPGYYMATQLAAHFALGEATREAQRLIDEGRPLRLVAARSKATRAPVRFHTFTGPTQIRMGRLSSNWSVETALQNLVSALRNGTAYGEA